MFCSIVRSSADQPPKVPEALPQVLAAGHHRVVILEHVVDRDRAHPERAGFDHGGHDELARQERHRLVAGQAARRANSAQIPAPASSEPPARLKRALALGDASIRRAVAANTA